MEVTLIGYTSADFAAIEELDGPGEWAETAGVDTTGASAIAEFAGRACYGSWSKPNPATATNATYLANIVEVGHFSVLEHNAFTFYITGVSRSFTHEQVRHRHLSFSQLSQRYVDHSDPELIVPPVLAEDGLARLAIAEAQMHASREYRYLLERAEALGLDRKAARGAARAVLPEATETKIVITGNARTWREVIAKRTALRPDGKPVADQEIFDVVSEIRRQLIEVEPNLFAGV